MRRARARLARLVVGAALSLLVATGVEAAEWGGITPGVSTRGEVEALYGRPTREQTLVQEGRSVPVWTYAGKGAPRGLDRMLVEFGLIGAEGFRADLVRSLTIYPKARVFPLETIGQAWGKPDAMGTDEKTGQPIFRYDGKGLLVVMDRSGEWAEMLLFVPSPPAPKP